MCIRDSVMQAANHLAGLRILNHDILGEGLVEVLKVAPIDPRDKALEEISVVDRHLLDGT